MRYFFLAYALIAIMVVGIFGLRGDKSAKTPIEIFPDMDRQDKIKAQTPNSFFADGLGSRQPVEGTLPQSIGDADTQFSGAAGYLATGSIDEYYGSGMPAELELTAEALPAFIARGEERYNISCMPCHGRSGDGGGIAAQFGVPGVANLHTENFLSAKYPDGRMFEVITKGKGVMSGYGYNISLEDRWAIIAYIRSMQLAQNAPLSNPKIKDAFEAATAGLDNK